MGEKEEMLDLTDEIINLLMEMKVEQKDFTRA